MGGLQALSCARASGREKGPGGGAGRHGSISCDSTCIQVCDSPSNGPPTLREPDSPEICPTNAYF